MDWEKVKSTISSGAQLIKEKSGEAVDYLKSEEFKEKVTTGVQKTKEGASMFAQKIKESETV